MVAPFDPRMSTDYKFHFTQVRGMPLHQGSMIQLQELRLFGMEQSTLIPLKIARTLTVTHT